MLELVHHDTIDGVQCQVSHLIYRNVFTEFDRKLSMHLAATRGEGFPAVSSFVRTRRAGYGDKWETGERSDHATVPHALKAIAERALGDTDQAEIATLNGDLGADDICAAAERRTVNRADLEALAAVLDNARAFGEFEFLDVSGDYGLVVVKTTGVENAPVTMDIHCGTMQAVGKDGIAFDGPLYAFTRLIGSDVSARAYMAKVRHAVLTSKEDAVMAFRAAAEDRIMSFDKALQGRPLEGFRFDAAIALVSRLKAGFGDNLFGLSEAAQITALEWAASIAREGGHCGSSDSRDVASPLGAGVRASAA